MGKYNIGDKFVVEVKSNYGVSGKENMYETEEAVFSESQLDGLDKLDCEYVNEYFGDLQDFAYEKGKEDAWKLAGRISGCTPDGLEVCALIEIFNTRQRNMIYKDFTVNQTMALVEQYEKNKEIRAGDIILTKDGEAIVTAIGDRCFNLVMLPSGMVRQVRKDCDYVKNKTGLSIDICNLLKEAAGVDRIAEQIN